MTKIVSNISSKNIQYNPFKSLNNISNINFENPTKNVNFEMNYVETEDLNLDNNSSDNLINNLLEFLKNPPNLIYSMIGTVSYSGENNEIIEINLNNGCDMVLDSNKGEYQISFEGTDVITQYDALMGTGYSFFDISNIKQDGEKFIFTTSDSKEYCMDGEGNIISITFDGKTYQNNDESCEYFDFAQKVTGADIVRQLTGPTKIFDEKNIDHRQYGGDQLQFDIHSFQFAHDEKILKILENYFPDATEEDYELLMDKVSTNSCVYTAEVTALFEAYEGREKEFLKTFGFPMYEFDKSGKLDFNYEPLILDWYLYNWKDIKGYDNIEDVYGNIEETKKDENLKETGATGLKGFDAKKFEKFLKEKYNIECDVNNINFDMGKISENRFNKLKEEGKSVIISETFNFDLYTIDPETGERGELYVENMDSHAMTVTGFTENGDMIVSSWGQQYILDPSLVNAYKIIDINI